MQTWIDWLNDHVYLLAGILSGAFMAFRKIFQIISKIEALEDKVKNLEDSIKDNKTDAGKISDDLISKLSRIEDKLDQFIMKQIKNT